MIGASIIIYSCLTLYYFVCRIVDVRYTVMLYTVFSFAVIGLEEVFAVYASTEVELGTYRLRNGQYHTNWSYFMRLCRHKLKS